ncbi:cytochrome c oxidase assembly factor 6 [Metschnikowia aff. pulcherrima]|uniref:Cytochrome c oxidase assembly factor 6 n=1 Tax=Metschnikowia aff. pulcherrima TaxID=2163413 RepID=A0A4V1ADU8_9ASCO|nr:cytochrome c oxidase assembly factor 6 [Metschnikowia aff. pulcherrima]
MHSLVTMGFFSKGEPVVDPPNKTKRKVCWDSRDKFFDCLAKHKIENSLDPKLNEQVESSCGGERVEFQDNCVASWFKYFQEKRYNDIKRLKYIAQLEAEGAKPLPFKLDRK